MDEMEEMVRTILQSCSEIYLRSPHVVIRILESKNAVLRLDYVEPLACGERVQLFLLPCWGVVFA